MTRERVAAARSELGPDNNVQVTRSFGLEQPGLKDKRTVIDVGKTKTGIQTWSGLETAQTIHASTWAGRPYQDFITFLSERITQSQLEGSAYIQIAVPFPFDLKTQRITTVKPARPDFTPEKDLVADLQSDLPSEYDDTRIVFINDVEAQTRGLAKRFGEDTSFMVLHQGTGINASIYDRGAVQTVEVMDIQDGERRFGALRGAEVTKDITKLAGGTGDDAKAFVDLLISAAENSDYKDYKAEMHGRWISYIFEIIKKVRHGEQDIRTLVIQDRIMEGGLFPLDIVKEMGLDIIVISDKEQKDITLQDLTLDNEEVRTTIALAQTRMKLKQLERSFVGYEIAEINETVDEEDDAIARANVVDFFTSVPEIDMRDRKGAMKLYTVARELQRVQGDMVLYPLPWEVRLDSAHPAHHKFLVEFAHSMNVVESLPPGTIVGISIPLYDEVTRIQAPDEDHPHGEDLVRNKLIQLEQLFSRADAEYHVVFVDDGSRDGTFELTKGLVEGMHLQKGSVEVVKLNDLLEVGDLEIAKQLPSDKESVKGGASLAGAERLIQDGVDYVVLSDADLEIHLGSLGVLLEPFLKDERVAMTVAHRQKFLSDAGKGLGHIMSIFTDRKKFNDKFRYLLPRFAITRTFFPELNPIPDYQTGFKGFRAEDLADYFDVARTFDASYDYDLIHHAYSQGDIQNVPVTPVFVSREATKFAWNDKTEKFRRYRHLAYERNSLVKFLAKSMLLPINYVKSVLKDLLIPGIKLPRKFEEMRTYFTDLSVALGDERNSVI